MKWKTAVINRPTGSGTLTTRTWLINRRVLRLRSWKDNVVLRRLQDLTVTLR
jgi:hypothetical protein